MDEILLSTTLLDSSAFFQLYKTRERRFSFYDFLSSHCTIDAKSATLRKFPQIVVGSVRFIPKLFNFTQVRLILFFRKTNVKPFRITGEKNIYYWLLGLF